MTFSDLTAILNWNGRENDVILSEFISILVKQTLNVNSNAEFLFLHFLNEFMSRTTDKLVPIAVFLTWSHAPHHYYHMERKMGINLDQWIKKERRMIFLDATQCFNAYSSLKDSTWSPVLQCPTSDKHEFFKMLSTSIWNHFQILKKEHTDSVTLIPLLIMDDLTVLYYAGYAVEDIMMLTLQFMKLIEDVSFFFEQN
jgi:hypothetical protein